MRWKFSWAAKTDRFHLKAANNARPLPGLRSLSNTSYVTDRIGTKKVPGAIVPGPSRQIIYLRMIWEKVRQSMY
jgi:hypothetical protein